MTTIHFDEREVNFVFGLDREGYLLYEVVINDPATAESDEVSEDDF